MKLIESQTYLNLAKSFAGECQARTRYQFIAYGAKTAKLFALAKVIQGIETNEFNHARMFYTFLQKATSDTIDSIEICSGYPFKEKWDLMENLRLASLDEKEEATEVYPRYRDIAKEEGFPEIAKLYQDIIQVETCHTKLLTDLYKQMSEGTMYKKKIDTKWKCEDCGYEATSKEAWTKCPLCDAPIGAVKLILKDN